MTEFSDPHNRERSKQPASGAGAAQNPNDAALRQLLDREPLTASAGLLVLLQAADFMRLIQRHPGRRTLTIVLDKLDDRLGDFSDRVEGIPDLAADLRQSWLSRRLALDFVLKNGQVESILSQYARGASISSRVDSGSAALATIDTRNFLLYSVQDRGLMGDPRSKALLLAAERGTSQVPQHHLELPPFVGFYARWADLRARSACWNVGSRNNDSLTGLAEAVLGLASDMRRVDLPGDDFLRMQRNVEVHAAALLDGLLLHCPWAQEESPTRLWADNMQLQLDKSEALVNTFIVPGEKLELLAEPCFDEILLRSFLAERLVFLGEWRAASGQLSIVRDFVDTHIDAVGSSDIRQQDYFPITPEETGSALLTRILTLQAITGVMCGGSVSLGQQRLVEAAYRLLSPEEAQLPAGSQSLLWWSEILNYLNMAGWGCRARGDKAVLALLGDLAEKFEDKYYQINVNARWAWK